MNKNQIFKFKWKNIIITLLIISCLLCELSDPWIMVTRADEISSVSLDYVSDVTIHTSGSTLRLYGSQGKSYRVPVHIMADCTIILDHMNNEMDLTVAAGHSVTIVLYGSNHINNIAAVGGPETHLTMKGGTADAMLTTNRIACAREGTTETGADIEIISSIIMCQDLGCGMDGVDASYVDGSATMANAAPGSNASQHVSIISSQLTVNGSIACGGNGVESQGTWSANASDGGTAGNVFIDNSRVSVGGNIAVGGTGGDGKIGTRFYDHVSGMTQSSCPVKIQNHSYVSAAGSVAGQPDLPHASKNGTQQGLHGVRVDVTDSTLLAKDIASGGKGHQIIRSDTAVYGSGTNYDVAGTAGGNGGTIYAEHAVIECDTAVCGANAGDYASYKISAYGDYSGDYESVYHPLDGNGGVIYSNNSDWTIRSYAGEKGDRWDDYANPSVYNEQKFIGGTLNGIVRGSVITTDITSILSGGFEPAVEIRNSEEMSCAKCLLKTDHSLAGNSVTVQANELSGSVRLNEKGQLYTYLAIGKQHIELTGTQPYTANIRVKRSSALNEFQLNAYGRLNMEYDDAAINADSYHYLDETYNYNGTYLVSGNGPSRKLVVEAGEHLLVFQKTQLDTLEIKGNSIVTIRLNDEVRIRQILVSNDATLIIEGEEYLEYVICQGILHKNDGTRLFPITFTLDHPNHYQLCLNEKQIVLSPQDQEIHLLLPEGACRIDLTTNQFVFRGECWLDQPQHIYQSDLMLWIDCSQAPVIIEESRVLSGDGAVSTQADICLTQSGSVNTISVKKKDAVLWLDQMPVDTQLYIPQDFSGEIRDRAGTPIRLVTIHTQKAAYPVTFELDGMTYHVETNEEGCFTFLATIGTHQFRWSIDDNSYWISPKLYVSAEDQKNDFTMDNMTDHDPDLDIIEPEPNPEPTDPDQPNPVPEPTEPDNPDSGNTDSGSTEPANPDSNHPEPGTTETDDTKTGNTETGNMETGNTETGNTKTDHTDSTQPSTDTDQSDSSSSAEADPGTSGSGNSNSSNSSNSSDSSTSGTGGTNRVLPGGGGNTTVAGNTQADLDKQNQTDSSDTSSHVPELNIKINEKKIYLLDCEQNDDTIHITKNNIRFKLEMQEGVTYRYKIVYPDKNDKKPHWVTIKSPSIKIAPDKKETQKMYVIFQAKNADGIQQKKTSCFLIDQNAPVISGIRHLHFYKNKRNIRISDNNGLRSIILNGKKMKSSFTVKKRGVYLLKAVDAAGNYRLRVFAIW